MICLHKFRRTRKAGKCHSRDATPPDVTSKLAMTVSKLVNVGKLECCHMRPGGVVSSKLDHDRSGGSGSKASKATSNLRTSHSFLPSRAIDLGILPSPTNSSNLVGEIPMYIAASIRERPRRGMAAFQRVLRASALFPTPQL